MIDPEGYSALIEKGDFDFIEVKAYMHVGASRERLSRDNMPTHLETKEFALSLLEHLPDYEFVAEQESSWVTLLAKKSYNKKTWINYPKFFEDAIPNIEVGQHE